MCPEGVAALLAAVVSVLCSNRARRGKKRSEWIGGGNVV